MPIPGPKEPRVQRVSVIGLGKMGLPIAAYLATHGSTVSGIDLDFDIVDSINSGVATVHGEGGLAEAVAEAVSGGMLAAHTSFGPVAESDVVVVLVPLLALNGEPDFSMLDAGVASIAANLSRGTLVVFETTLPVGTTRDRFAPVLREAAPDVKVAFSPERVFSGRVFSDLETYPKIVGGIDEASTSRAVDFYQSVLSAEVWSVDSSEEAEMVKLAETTYRDLNIAYANELARICDELGLDVVDVIKGANSQPFSHIHTPGIGVGGHCIPHYPHLLLNAGVPSDLIATARTINDGMPAWAVSKLDKELGGLEGKTVVGLGVAYRPGVREHVSSPAFGVRESLAQHGATFFATDPLYSDADLAELGFTPWDGESVPDAVVLITPHEQFDESLIAAMGGVVFLDGRNAWDQHTVEQNGARYLGFGR